MQIRQERNCMNRSDFLKRAAHAAAAFALGPLLPARRVRGRQAEEVPVRKLGKSGVRVSMLGMGGYHLGQAPEREVQKMVDMALAQGINFFDTAESYQNGGSETRLGRALLGKRDKVFLMTKTYEPANRDAAGARRHLEGSLKRLQTDHLDLWQLHSVQSPEDVDRAFRAGGAMEYILRAKEQGRARFVGVTGHVNPKANLRAIHYWDRGWTFDTMQMPVNPLDYHQESFARQVLPELVKRKIGVIAMKTSAQGRLLREELCSIDECLQYVWSLPVSVAVVGMVALKELEHNCRLAKRFQPLSQIEKEKLIARLAPAARLELEWYKRRL